ncbi:MAG TPA: hypothetical protein DD670_12085 [Planctomycetaceae bacterium]|nr:hypothetical protein [Planctomycetaceae bacterium]
MRQEPFMRLPFHAVLIALVFATLPAWGETTFPYKAYVTAQDVYIRSGPGTDYYPTDKLAEGQAVEVYRHDPGGWCAIRPPKGSFTWVSSRYLEPAGNGLAKVTNPRIAARVGSRFSPVRDIIQVRLNQDELVEVLESSSRGGDDDWTKIAPPSGEFRWIHSRYLDPEYPTHGLRRSSDEDEARDGSDSENEYDDRGRHDAARPGEDGSSADAGSRRTARRGAARTLSPEEYAKRLDDMNIELGAIVAEETTVWAFDELALDAEQLLAQAETAIERGRARMLLSKIERFENIKQRHDAVNQVVADTGRRDRRLAMLSSQGDTGPSDRFDGRGRLTRVQSTKPGMPRYALVDESGAVTCYVTPSPGMNLRHYEQRTVGVTGTRGYIPEQRAPHVMARHIDVLEGRTLR